MKVQLEFQFETLAEFRIGLEKFLGAVPTAASEAAIATSQPKSGDSTPPTPPPAKKLATTPKGPRPRSAADIALGLDPEDDDSTMVGETDSRDTESPQQLDIEDLLADKAQLSFEFDRVLALQGRAAALGIVRGVLPAGGKAKLKDLDGLPVALIPAAVAALQAARVD
jgi:hypothetical protein